MRGPHILGDVGAIGGQLLGASFLALEPAIPPAHRLAMEVGTRARPGEMRVFVDPRADKPLGLLAQTRHRRGRRVPIPVRPARDHEAGDLDRGEILADRAVFPIGIAPLMSEPGLDAERLGLEAREPLRLPAIAHQRRIGRPRRIGQHIAGPGHVRREQATVLEMDVVVVAVDRRGDADDGLERLRPKGCHLQRVEPAPGDAHHADGAGAPGLRRDPVEHLAGLASSLGEYSSSNRPVALPAALDVDAHAGISGCREDRVIGHVARRRAVAFTIRDVFEDRRHRLPPGIGRKPDLGRQPQTVLERNPRILDDLVAVGDRCHCAPIWGLCRGHYLADARPGATPRARPSAMHWSQLVTDTRCRLPR